MPNELELSLLPMWQLYVFFSVDLENSTAYKVSARKMSGNDYDWCNLFNKFYQEFPSQFFLKSYEKSTEHVTDISRPSVWKFVGDEILFYAQLKHSCNVLEHVRIFHDAILKYNSVLEQRESTQNRDHSDKQVRCKGTMWIAGCPINNRAIAISNPDEEKEGNKTNLPNLDFIGSSIDCGFRLTKFSSSKQMALSLDLVWMLAESFQSECTTNGTVYEFVKTRIKFFGYHELKGVCGGRPYPVFVFNINKQSDKVWDGHSYQPDDLIRCCELFATSVGDEYFIKPFIDGDSCRFGTKPDRWEEKLQSLHSFLKKELSVNTKKTASSVPNDETPRQNEDIPDLLKPVSE